MVTRARPARPPSNGRRPGSRTRAPATTPDTMDEWILTPRRRYLDFVRAWVGPRDASRRAIRESLVKLGPGIRRGAMQHAAYNTVKELNERAGAPSNESGATTNLMLTGETEPLRAARPLVRLYQRTTTSGA